MTFRSGSAACFLAALAFAAGAAHAGEAVHKCVDDGHVTYQAGPCPHDDVVLLMPAAPSASDVAAAHARAQRVAASAAAAAPKSASAASSGSGAGRPHARSH